MFLLGKGVLSFPKAIYSTKSCVSVMDESFTAHSAYHLETSTIALVVLLSLKIRKSARPAQYSSSSSDPSWTTPSSFMNRYAYTLWVALDTFGRRSKLVTDFFTSRCVLISTALASNRLPLSSTVSPQAKSFVSSSGTSISLACGLPPVLSREAVLQHLYVLSPRIVPELGPITHQFKERSPPVLTKRSWFCKIR